MSKWYSDMDLNDVEPLLETVQEFWVIDKPVKGLDRQPQCAYCEEFLSLALSTVPHNGFGSRFVIVDIDCQDKRCGFRDQLSYSLERSWTARTLLHKILRGLKEASGERERISCPEWEDIFSKGGAEQGERERTGRKEASGE